MTAKRKPTAKCSSSKPALPASPTSEDTALFDRVASILEQARGNVVRAVNTNMVLAYWLIGREIVQEIQGGGIRAAYGTQVLANLSQQLTRKYGQGFSVTNLQNFRKFHQAYALRLSQIQHPLGIKLGLIDTPPPIQHPAGAESLMGFSPQLSWSHFRALMRVQNAEARDFYEHEAIAGGWDKRTLERQIHSFYYERLLKSQNPKKMLTGGRKLQTQPDPAVETLKNPYVLEFLGLPEVAKLHESELEAAILTYLQGFLLELGKGFAFVARQKRLSFGDDDHYVDLVFYHCHLKFYLLIDLKLEELTHGDVGQMDGYVRLFDDLVAIEGDNPTIGLILCTENNETVARYSVLKDRKQIFASKYMLYLPSEQELREEIERERRLIEGAR